LLDRIAAIPGPLAGEHVYEVGPGPGGLTRAPAHLLLPLSVTTDAYPRSPS
jgi:16S rRNA A1518/A1519 N6-dimethyltransferase RsmA/KsgA/DIM1 with predicted DNA glycosylase/AP lyase activity